MEIFIRRTTLFVDACVQLVGETEPVIPAVSNHDATADAVADAAAVAATTGRTCAYRTLSRG